MRWNLKSKPEKQKVQNLQNALQVDEIIATLLVQRGIETFEQAKTFFQTHFRRFTRSLFNERYGFGRNSNRKCY